MLWIVLMTILFLMPTDNISRAPELPHFDKIIHAFMFAVLVFLLMLDRKQFSAWYRVIGFAILYGLLLELLQEWMDLGRSGEWLDLWLDISGSLLGLLIYFIYTRIRYTSTG